MFVTYLFIAAIIIILLWLAFADKNKIDTLKKNGIRVSGNIIENKDTTTASRDFYRLGGNINNPTVRFTTKDGKLVTGEPIIGFVSQHEIIPPVSVNVIYDPKNPQRFCLEL